MINLKPNETRYFGKKSLVYKAEMKKIFDIRNEAQSSRHLTDGIYNMTDIEFISLEALRVSYATTGYIAHIKYRKELRKAMRFIKKYPKPYFASAYEIQFDFLLAKKPKKIRAKISQGSGFNYGSTNILTNCPKDILILAEWND